MEIASPRLRRLRQEVRRLGDAALDPFWAEVAESGSPLIEPLPDAPAQRLVTVLWRQRGEHAGVFALINRITDKDKARRGLMHRLPGTDVWFVSFRAPGDLRAAYSLYPFGGKDPYFGPDGDHRVDTREIGRHAIADPLNRRARGPMGEAFGSLIELDGAPSLDEWTHRPDRPVAGTRRRFEFRAHDGETYRVQEFVPAASESGSGLGLLVVLDGEVWFDRFDIPAAISAGVAAGRFRPAAVVGVESGDAGNRAIQLGANPAFVSMLADDLVPHVTQAWPDWAGPRRTVLCGQSLGGLTALVAAERADVFGAVLAHSPSIWWRPGTTSRPSSMSHATESWLYERYAALPVSQVRIRLAVGSNEGAMVTHLERLHRLMRERGFDADLAIYTGGHDWSCWATAIIDGLTAADSPT